jgi:hypothetical protein
MLRALGDIAATTTDPHFRRLLTSRGQRIVAGCAEKLRKEEIKEIRGRLETLEKLTV